MTWLVRLIVFCATAYLAILTLLFLFQTSILFPSRRWQDDRPAPAGAERIEVRIADGQRLGGLHFAPASGKAGSGPVILGFGGNAWDADLLAQYLHELYPGEDVVAFHYRGYGPNQGEPAAATLLADAPLVYDFVKQRFKGRPIVAVGFSIGSGVAARVAKERDPAGLILVTPFDSLTKVVEDQYPWVPVRLLLKHRIDTLEALRGSQLRVALIAGERDRLVRAQRTAALRKAVENPVLDRTIRGADHNDIYDRPEFREAMIEALARMNSDADSRP